MSAWELSAGLVQIVALLGALALEPALRRWLGGPARTYLIMAGGMVALLTAEGLRFTRLVFNGAGARDLAWDSIDIAAAGYLAVFLGLLIWGKDQFHARSRVRRVIHKLKRLSAIDSLTGLFTRRAAKHHIERERARAQRNGRPIAFIMMDVDNFKHMNDTYGHQAGDAILKHVSRLIKRRLRKSDIVARYGGEEFLIVLPETDLANSVMVANALRQLIALSPARPGAEELTISASFGVAMALAPQDVGTREIIGRADAALYRSKALGRDRVTAWENTAEAAADRAPTVAAQAIAGAPG